MISRTHLTALGATLALALAGAPSALAVDAPEPPQVPDAPVTMPVDAGAPEDVAPDETAPKAETPRKPASTDKGKGNAYGKYCKGQSKKRVKGEKGTAFSRCVKAMAKLAKGDASPRKACATMSKKRVKGEKGTAFSRCVKAAAQLKRDQREAEEQEAAEDEATEQEPAEAPEPAEVPADQA